MSLDEKQRPDVFTRGSGVTMGNPGGVAPVEKSGDEYGQRLTPLGVPELPYGF